MTKHHAVAGIHTLLIQRIEHAIDDNQEIGVLVFDPHRGTHWRRTEAGGRLWVEIESGETFYKVGPNLVTP